MVLHRSQRLGEDVSQLLMSIDVGELDLVCFNFLSQPVVLDVEMLRPFGETRVSRYLNARLRVVMEYHAVVFLKDFEITAQSLKVQRLLCPRLI